MSSIQPLLDTMQKLRDKEDGCPWDIEQTFESLSKHLIEEAYEATDAIAKKDYLNLKEELGDVLLQVIFHSQIASELELFDFKEVSDSLNEKLIRRHTYVFNGGEKPFSAKDQTRLWEAIKEDEKKNIKPSSIFEDIPNSMPPSLRAERIQKKASKKGFDWNHPHEVIAKIDEEIEELKVAIANQDKNNIEEEKPSNGLENFAIEEESPELFNQEDDNSLQEFSSSDDNDNSSEEDDLEIPAFLRRQKN